MCLHHCCKFRIKKTALPLLNQKCKLLIMDHGINFKWLNMQGQKSDCFLELYAQPGIHDSSKCWRHCRMGARSILYAHHTCFCYLCKEDLKKFTPSFMQRFLTAGRCNSLRDLQIGTIEMFKGLNGSPSLNYTYYYCYKPVQTLHSHWDSIGL